MTWVKLDDGFYRNPKARAAGKDGRALFLAACCWSASNLTDGHIPAAALAPLLADAEVKYTAVESLVAAGLWHENGTGWVVNDFLEWNESKASVEQRREAWRERQAKARTKPGRSR